LILTSEYEFVAREFVLTGKNAFSLGQPFFPNIDLPSLRVYLEMMRRPFIVAEAEHGHKRAVILEINFRQWLVAVSYRRGSIDDLPFAVEFGWKTVVVMSEVIRAARRNQNYPDNGENPHGAKQRSVFHVGENRILPRPK